MSELDQLKIRFINTLQKFHLRGKYVHLRSIRNFLQFYPALADDAHRELVISNLSAFFDRLDEMSYDELNTKSATILFDRYITPLVTVYGLNCRFAIYLPPVIIISAVALISLVTFFLPIGNYRLIITAILAFIVVRRINKERARRICGIFY